MLHSFLVPETKSYRQYLDGPNIYFYNSIDILYIKLKFDTLPKEKKKKKLQ